MDEKWMESLSLRKLTGRESENARSRILRGVYEENHSLHDFTRTLRKKSSRGLAWQVRQWISIVALLLTLVGLALPIFVGRNGQTMATQPVVKTEVVASVVPATIPPAGTENIVNSGEVKSLEARGNIPLSQMLNLGIRRIVIDAGHGGADTGAIGREGTKEKDITLSIAMKLRDFLSKMGIADIRMTRTRDTTVSLQDRMDFAKRAKADMFISIHVNSLPNSPKNVVETFYFGPSADQRTLQLADQENKGSQYGLSDFQEIVERLGKTMKLQESRKLAEAIQKDLYQVGRELDPNVIDTGVKKAPFVVLMGLDVPSVLVEVSCMSNTKAEHYLNSEVNQDRIAASIAAGVMRYQNKGVVKNEGK